MPLANGERLCYNALGPAGTGGRHIKESGGELRCALLSDASMTVIGAAHCAAGLSYPVQEERAWVSLCSPLTVPLCRGRFWNADRS